jgi:hypothetical protein
MQRAQLAGDVGARVDAADERADLAAGQALDGFAERGSVRVLKQQPQLTQALMLTHLLQVQLGRSKVEGPRSSVH